MAAPWLLPNQDDAALCKRDERPGAAPRLDGQEHRCRRRGRGVARQGRCRRQPPAATGGRGAQLERVIAHAPRRQQVAHAPRCYALVGAEVAHPARGERQLLLLLLLLLLTSGPCRCCCCGRCGGEAQVGSAPVERRRGRRRLRRAALDARRQGVKQLHALAPHLRLGQPAPQKQKRHELRQRPGAVARPQRQVLDVLALQLVRLAEQDALAVVERLGGRRGGAQRGGVAR